MKESTVLKIFVIFYLCTEAVADNSTISPTSTPAYTEPFFTRNIGCCHYKRVPGKTKKVFCRAPGLIHDPFQICQLEKARPKPCCDFCQAQAPIHDQYWPRFNDNLKA